MNEIFDKLIIRVLFTLFICFALFIYKYAHVLFYPSKKKQVLKRIYPSENYIDTLHIFSRLVGIALIFSTLEFNEYIGISISSLHFFIWSFVGIIFYLISLWILENIIFYNFEYKDEVLKKKNPAYGIVSFANAICCAFIIRTVFKESENSIVILIILWLFALVIFGFATRLFRYMAQLSFNSLMIQKNLGLALAYSGFLFGNTVLLKAIFSHEHHDITSYMVQVILKVLLALIILPIFRYGILYIFKIEEAIITKKEKKTPSTEPVHLGYGIYIGMIYLTSALLTSIIISQIHFGTIYPFF
mgnify:CR=1 FL=1